MSTASASVTAASACAAWEAGSASSQTGQQLAPRDPVPFLNRRLDDAQAHQLDPDAHVLPSHNGAVADDRPGEQPLRRRSQPDGEGGYGGARMAAVAERAGIAKGLIYHYVPSKQALFSATVWACTQPAFEAAERQVADCTGSARDLLAALLTIA